MNTQLHRLRTFRHWLFGILLASLLVGVSTAAASADILVQGAGPTACSAIDEAAITGIAPAEKPTSECTVDENQDAAVYGPNGSQDPALGFAINGGASDVIIVDGTVYGPNGSIDPALGYSRGSTDAAEAAEEAASWPDLDPSSLGEQVRRVEAAGEEAAGWPNYDPSHITVAVAQLPTAAGPHDAAY